MVSPQSAEDGITVPREVLLKTQSGVLVINIQGGKLAKSRARLEILFDDGYWPTYSTEPSRAQTSTWDEVGEAFIRELDYSVIWLKLNQAAKDSRDDVFAAAKYDMNEFLELCLDKPHDFVLEDDNGGNKSLVTLTAKYIPVDIQILPRESVNNMGILNIELIEGKNLPAADRNGKSDPYVKFRYLKDGKTIFKSEIIKKNLNPVWNEKFSTQVESRTRNDLTLEVYDWDLAGDDDYLGIGNVQLTELEPFAPSEQSVPLSDPKTGKKQGEIRLRILFTPQFISRSRTQTSTFGAAGRVATGLGGVVAGVGGAGVGVVGMGAKGVGKGIGGIGSGIGSAFRRGNKGSIASIDEVAEQQSILNGADAPPVPPLPSGIQPAPLATAAEQAAFSGQFAPINGAGGIGAAGQLTVTIAEATSPEPDAKVYVRAVQAGKEVAETGVIKAGTDKYESFTVRTAKGPCDLQLFLMKKKFGKDKELGETPLTVWQYIQPWAPSPITTASASLQLSSGQGSINVRLDWQASPVQLGEGGPPPSPKGSSASIRGSRLSTFSRSSNVGN